MTWQTKKLEQLLVKSQNSAKLSKSKFLSNGAYPVIDQGKKNIAGYTNDERYLYKGTLPVVIFGDHTLIIKYADFPFVRGADGTKILTPNSDYLLPKFLYYLLLSKKIESHGYSRHYRYLQDAQFQIPPIKTQRRIVEKLDEIRKLQELNQKEIEKAEILFASGINSFFNLNGVIKPLGSVCRVVGGGTPSRENKSFYSGKIPWVTIKDLSTIEISDSKEHINDDAISNSATNLVEENTILVATRVGLGKMGMAKTKLTFNQDIKGLICAKEILPYYLLYFLLSQAKFIERSGQGATVKGINQDLLKKIKIPVPAISIQQEIVNKLNSLFKFKTQLSQTKDLLFELFESTLNKTMRGELIN